MKPHRILKAFTGSQDGLISRDFIEGQVALLSDSLAEAAVKAGYAIAEETPKTVTTPEPESPVDAIAEEAKPADEPEEMKVATPAETKPKKGRK